MNFPPDMQLVPLTSIAEVNPARSVKELSLDTEVSFITMGDVSESGRLVSTQARRYSDVKQGFTAFEEGDVLFAKITPCMENGKGCIAADLTNSRGFGSTEFHVLRAIAEGVPGFVYQWSVSKELRIEAKNSMTGSAGQQRVPSEFFSKFMIPEFRKPEQVKIGEILSTVDHAIEQTEALIAKQERVKTGLMQDLLTHGIDEHGNLRYESTHQFKDSSLGRIPVEWDAKPLSTIADLQVGYAFKSAWFADDGVRLLRGENVGVGTPDWGDTKCLPSSLTQSYSEYTLVLCPINNLQ